MNKPNIADFLELSGTNWNLYCRELSNYCDELEIALDKACELIENYHTALYNLTVGGEFRVIKANDWKEVLLNDE